MKKNFLLSAILLFGCSAGLFAQADMKEVIGMVKKNLATSKANLINYEWQETTTTFYKGEQKSVKQNRCYYSVDGKLTKVEAGGSTQEKAKGGIKGKKIENKKEEMADYINKAMTKVRTYLPPDATKLQQLYGSGKTTVQVLEPGKKFKLNCPDYNVKGDMLSLSINNVSQKLMMMDVSTYLDKPDEKVLFNVTYSDLPDGTQYAATTTVDAPSEQLKIVIVNSGFKKSSAN
jgi:hypothetical protein